MKPFKLFKVFCPPKYYVGAHYVDDHIAHVQNFILKKYDEFSSFTNQWSSERYNLVKIFPILDFLDEHKPQNCHWFEIDTVLDPHSDGFAQEFRVQRCKLADRDNPYIPHPFIINPMEQTDIVEFLHYHVNMNVPQVITILDKTKEEIDQLVKEKLDSIDADKLCMICNEQAANGAIIPCGHIVCYDGKCRTQLNKCPTCRGPIESVLKLFY